MKNLKINKQLINAVYPVISEALGYSYSISVDNCDIDFCQNNKIIKNHNLVFVSNDEQFFEISLDSFAFKCKEWAFKKGFNIFSSCKSFSIFQNGVLICSSSGENNEIEAIIKACEWILENEKNPK